MGKAYKNLKGNAAAGALFGRYSTLQFGRRFLRPNVPYCTFLQEVEATKKALVARESDLATRNASLTAANHAMEARIRALEAELAQKRSREAVVEAKLGYLESRLSAESDLREKEQALRAKEEELKKRDQMTTQTINQLLKKIETSHQNEANPGRKVPIASNHNCRQHNN